jgi:hypothetical protein
LSSKNEGSTTATPTDVAGTYASADGMVSMTIPPSVLSAYSKPAANVDANPPALTDTVNLKPVGSSYTMAPVNAVFTTPVTLTFKYVDASLPAGIAADMIRVYNYQAGAWVVTSAVPPTLNTALKTVTITVNDFKNPMYRLVGDIRINKLAVASVAVASGTSLNVVFNKELDPATVNVVPTAAVYDAATKTVTLTVPDQSANENAAVAVAVSTAVKDQYNQTYDPASQPGTGETATTVDLTLDAVTGLTPALNGATGGTPVVVQANTGTTTLSWNAATYNNSSADMTYVVEIGAAGVTDFSGTLKTYETTATSVNVSDLEKDTAFDWYNEWSWTAGNPVLKTYYWRIRAIYKKGDAASVTSANSATSNVNYDRPNELPTVPADPKVDSAVADANTILVPGKLLSWTASTDPEGLTVSYSIQFDTKNDFTSGLSLSATAIAAVNYDAAAALAGLTDDTVYYWRVKSVDPRGGESAWSSVSQFFLNKANNAAQITNMAPINGQGLPNNANGKFTADVTNTDRDTYSYTVNIYTDAAGTAPAGVKADATALPVTMADITWEAGHPVEDTQDYYWKLTVKETTTTYNTPAAADVVSPLQKFVKSDGDSKPVVTINDPATPKDGANYQLGKDTAVTWSATDTDSNVTALTYDVAVFSSDSDSAVLFTYTTAANVLTSTIATIKTDHGLTKDSVTYYLGVRASDGADFANDDSRDSVYGDWVRKPFIYKEGPTVTNVTIGNVTDQQFTVLWRTDSDATTQNDKLYYTTDGSNPTSTSTSVADITALNKVHLVNVNLGSSQPGTVVKFYVESESTVLAGLKTADNNSGNYYTVTMGTAAPSPPPTPDTFVVSLTNSSDNNIFVCKLKEDKSFMGTSYTVYTYNYIGVVAQSKFQSDQTTNRLQDDGQGPAGGLIASVETTMKFYESVYHSDASAKTISGEFDITNDGTFDKATIDVQ